MGLFLVVELPSCLQAEGADCVVALDANVCMVPNFGAPLVHLVDLTGFAPLKTPQGDADAIIRQSGQSFSRALRSLVVYRGDGGIRLLVRVHMLE